MTKTRADTRTAVVSAKGWIVIPAALRRRYAIEPGQEIRIVDYGGVLSLVPALREPIDEGRGVLRRPERTRPLTEALLTERRRERERER